MRLSRIELPCRDVGRQRDFLARALQLPLVAERPNPCFDVGGIELVLRPRGDALFASGEGGVLLAFPVPADELDRWHRRMMTARVAILEPPAQDGSADRRLRIADPEGNVIELFAVA